MRMGRAGRLLVDGTAVKHLRIRARVDAGDAGAPLELLLDDRPDGLVSSLGFRDLLGSKLVEPLLKDTKFTHLVHRELHHGERRVVARDLEAVHDRDDGEGLPVILDHRRVARGVLLIEQHQRRQRHGAEDHVRRRHHQREPQTVQTKRPAVEQIKKAVQDQVPVGARCARSAARVVGLPGGQALG